MVDIKVLGPGCPNCEKVEAAVKVAVNMLGAEARISKITDYEEIRSYNVLATPGLVIDGKLVSAGRIPSEGEVTTWVADALIAAEGQ